MRCGGVLQYAPTKTIFVLSAVTPDNSVRSKGPDTTENGNPHLSFLHKQESMCFKMDFRLRGNDKTIIIIIAKIIKFMHPKKRHHYLPIFYLEGFIDPTNEPYVWIYEKGNSSVRKATANNIGVQKGFYTFTTKERGKDSNTIENAFEKVETACAPVLRKIRNFKNLNKKEKSNFSLFLALMILRVPNFRENIIKSLNDFKQKILSSQNDTKIDPNYDLKMAISISQNPIFAQIFSKMKWVFIEATGDFKFVTSDNPLSCCDPIRNQKSLYETGLINKNVEVTFPISSSLALLASWNGQEGFRKAKNSQIIEDINRRTISSASRFVYSSINSEPLNQVVQKYKNSAPKMELI